MRYKCPINMKYKEVSLLSTQEIKDLGYLLTWVRVRTRAHSDRHIKKYNVPFEISGSTDEQKVISEFDVTAQGIDGTRFNLNPDNGIELLQKYLNEKFPQYSFYVVDLGMIQISTSFNLVWHREKVAEKPVVNGLTLKYINGKERDEDDLTESELKEAGDGLSEEFCLMVVEQNSSSKAVCRLPY